jgi:aminopeptidase N
MRRFLLFLFCWPALALAAPHLELDVRLDPASRHFEVTAKLSDEQGIAGFNLSPEFNITALAADGKRLSPAGSERHGRRWLSVPRGTRQITLSYRAELQPLAPLDHRQVMHLRAPTASPDGSFLPARAGWYPDPGALSSYRLALALPAGQKGLVPGELLKEVDGKDGYRAEFDFPHPSDGIDLTAGPYTVAARNLKLASGRTIRIRTWFHAELAPLAPGYLDDSARYIDRYSTLIGDYPFAMFSVVSSPTPTGFGMPSLTYLGRDVLKLPFIRATSLGHEVLHNWWGNGVYPDWSRGNWSEGLTTFLADYAYKEDEGADAARDMRLGWLRDLAAVPPGDDGALKDFTSRHHGISSIVGYNKAAMVFLMLRDRIGTAAFERGLRLLWQSKRFQTASWADLEAAFTTASGQPLADFFKQWVEHPGTPKHLEPDPEYRIWRRIDPALLPAILREVFIAPKAVVLVIDAELRAAAEGLATRLLDDKSALAIQDRAGGVPTLVIGLPTSIDAWLVSKKLPPRPLAAKQRGTAHVWAGRDLQGIPYVVISASDAAAVTALARPLPHYGKQGWLVFDGAKVLEKGVDAPLTGARAASRAPG